MLMIPITFLPATALGVAVVWLVAGHSQRLRAPWLIAFLGVLAVQLFLLGARYGYGMQGVLDVQHFTGAAIPPLAYLAFANPPFGPRVLRHALPVLAVWLVTLFAIPFADIALGLLTLGYALGLIAALLRNGDNLFAWAPLRYCTTLRLGLYATVATLVLSGMTDWAIAVDFFVSGGSRTAAIAAAASLGSLVLLAIGMTSVLRFGGRTRPAASTDTDTALVARLRAEIARKELFRDPDLTLGRLAKRLGLPAREVSSAVNRVTGLNMSQFINNMRIESVCEMLGTSTLPITTTMLEAGFYTKSNFNREFRRVMGQTPSQWRAQTQQP